MHSKFRNTVSVSAISLGILWSSAPSQANALEDIFGPNAYVSVFGGASFARAHASYSTDHYEIKLKDGFTVGAVIGSHIGNGFRLERELSYQRHMAKSASYEGESSPTYDDIDGDISALFLMTNLWKDIEVSDRIRPYVGGGLGVALLSADLQEGDDPTPDDFIIDDSSLGLAAQLGVGARFAVTDRFSLDVGYRYRAVIDASFMAAAGGNESHGAFSDYSHNLLIGASYALGESSQILPTDNGGESQWYASVFGGALLPDVTAWEYEGSIYSIDHKNGFTIGAAVGTHLAPGLRTELELSYARAALKSYSTSQGNTDDASGHLEQAYLLGNIWKDFHLGGVSPYIGGGVGFGMVHFDNADADGSELSGKRGYGLAGQFGAGARMALSDNIVMDVGYRYKSIVDAFVLGGNDWTYNYDVATHNHIVQLGVTYGLGTGASVTPVADLPETPDSRYVSLFGGFVMPLDTHMNYDGSNYLVDFKNGFTVGAAVGADLTDTLRGEVELSYVASDVKRVYEQDVGDVTDSTGNSVNGVYLLANLWRDFDMGGFSPYVGGGVGMALMDVDVVIDDPDERVKDSSIALAAQLGTGVRIPLSDSFTLDAGYRFKAALGVFTEGAVDDADHSAASYYSHIGQIGVSMKF